MKSLVVYYSRSGNTRKVAEAVALAASADIEEIREDGIDRSGALGYLRSGKGAFLKRSSRIHPSGKNPKYYDTVFIGSPVWAGDTVPAVRSYLSENPPGLGRVAFFSTCGGGSDKKLLESLKSLTKGSRLLGSISVTEKELKDKQAVGEKIRAWVAGLAGM